jgi:hypothetical protein
MMVPALKSRAKLNTFQISHKVAHLAYCRIAKHDICQEATLYGIQNT